MQDYRMLTFLTLCDQMNYRKTAELLNMTQPAVTQHIHTLEDYYGQKLFDYTGRQLSKTKAGLLLEQQGRIAQYNQQHLKEQMGEPKRQVIRIGATKTIGTYVVGKGLAKLMSQADLSVTLLVENTQQLLEKLSHTQLDVALIEGYFDKQAYGHHLMRREPLVGICPKGHQLAGQKVPLDRLRQERLLLREEGSGTRAVFAQMLQAHNYPLEGLTNTACISSIEVIKELVLAGQGLAFVYESVAKSHPDLACFQTELGEIVHEFHYVYLKDTPGEALSLLLEAQF